MPTSQVHDDQEATPPTCTDDNLVQILREYVAISQERDKYSKVVKILREKQKRLEVSLTVYMQSQELGIVDLKENGQLKLCTKKCPPKKPKACEFKDIIDAFCKEAGMNDSDDATTQPLVDRLLGLDQERATKQELKLKPIRI